MAEITPEDVAKGMLEHLTKQQDSVLISRKNFMDISKEVAKRQLRMNSDKVPDPLIELLLTMERVKFMCDIADAIFGKKEDTQ